MSVDTQPIPPSPPPPARQTDPAIIEARRRRMRERQGRSGFRSTILTGPQGAQQPQLQGALLTGGGTQGLLANRPVAPRRGR